MNSHHCRPNDDVADAQEIPCSATTSLQYLWRHLACPRRQVVQSSLQAIPDSKRIGIPSSFSTEFRGLPEVLKAHVLEFSGNSGSLSLCLASQDLHTCTWQSREVWQARLALTGAIASAGPTADLRDQYRWQSCGIDALCRFAEQQIGTSNGVSVLANASRAVRALEREDAPFMDLISTILADLMRWYDSTDELAHEAAQGLLQVVNSRSYLFTSEHTRSISSAFDSACSLREVLLGSEAELAIGYQEEWEAELWDDLPPWDDLSTYMRADLEGRFHDCWELSNRRPDDWNEDENISEVAEGRDDEACERMMELLRSLPEAETLDDSQNLTAGWLSEEMHQFN